MLRVYGEHYRRTTTLTHMSEEFEEDISCLQGCPELWQERELIILKCLAGGEHFSWMNQEQTIAINWILVK
jgi:hypothetical protein